MRGDLSTRYQGPDSSSFDGVLFQQGRVFLDRDGNAQTAIAVEWQDLAARDVIGSDVLAVPGDDADAFRVEAATLNGGEVTLTVHPGHAWADGMLVRLAGAPPIKRLVSYLGPPFEDPVPPAPVAGDRDAVVLEVSRHEVNGFQLPDTLLEPALGGVDTTERITTRAAFRLYRMDPDDTCDTLAAKLADDPSAKGTLTATLQPTTIVAGDCPTVDSGGYTGFEHELYRVEIAAVNAGGPMFKWSRFNGGLVGRATFDAPTLRATITANLAAIATSDLTDFYLETVEWDAAEGVWAVTCGAAVTLLGDQLVLPAAPTFGAIPAAGAAVFIRLWDGIRPLADFPVAANPTELIDGIRLEFEADAPGRYTAEDFWTFPVRAGGLGNPGVLVDGPPEGVYHRRVAVAELLWDGAAEPGEIEDCRRRFQPLTRLGTCCTYRVGDGVVSHGDFTSIQAAINALPAAGGKVCVLPGTFIEAVRIQGRRGVTVSGCGSRTRVVAPPGKAEPVFHVLNAGAITLQHMLVESDRDGIGVLLEPGSTLKEQRRGVLRQIVLDDLLVRAASRTGIECRGGEDVTVRDCTVSLADMRSLWPGIFFIAHQGLLEGNRVLVAGRVAAPLEDDVVAARAGLGGIQLGGGCRRVRVIGNVIHGGVGNGITLGSVRLLGGDGDVIIGWIVDRDDPCNPCKPGDTGIVVIGGDDGPRLVSDGPLRDIVIEDNRILDMGLNGIGVIGYFALRQAQEIVTVLGLRIEHNEIRRCLTRALAPIGDAYTEVLGYGGIALADVAQLEVLDNVIEDNGPDHIQPVCGVFLLHGEGVEIRGNRIARNGARTEEPAAKAKAGPRGGIYVAHCSTLGGPALRVHDNRVSAPLGRALTAEALGDVSVHGNHFTTLGVEPGPGDGLQPAATVLIRSLAAPSLFAADAGYRAIRVGKANIPYDPAVAGTGTHVEPTASASVPGGEARVLFADNQLVLAAPDEAVAFTSVLIEGLGDVAFEDNESSVTIASGGVITNLWAFGATLRVIGNRFTEPLPNALLSGITLGVMNMTNDNQANHCLLIRGWAGAGLLVDQPNSILIAALSPQFCERLGRLLPGFGAVVGQG